MTQLPTPKSIISAYARPISIIGMMGAGKTTLGSALAKELGREFYDSDHVIEQETGKTVPQIFETEGAEAFRRYEGETLQRLLIQAPQAVISTGGGSITIPTTADLLFKNSLSIWVHAPLETLVARTSQRKNRPLLNQGNQRDILSDLLDQRNPIYRRAPIHVETSDAPLALVVEQAMRQISEYLLKQTL